jgi:hypothetical protein
VTTTAVPKRHAPAIKIDTCGHPCRLIPDTTLATITTSEATSSHDGHLSDPLVFTTIARHRTDAVKGTAAEARASE